MFLREWLHYYYFNNKTILVRPWLLRCFPLPLRFLHLHHLPRHHRHHLQQLQHELILQLLTRRLPFYPHLYSVHQFLPPLALYAVVSDTLRNKVVSLIHTSHPIGTLVAVITTHMFLGPFFNEIFKSLFSLLFCSFGFVFRSTSRAVEIVSSLVAK